MRFICIFLLSIGLIVTPPLFSSSYGNYGGGNGTVLRVEEIDGWNNVVRLHIQDISVDEYVPAKLRTMYDRQDLESKQYIFSVGETIHIKELVLSQELSTGLESLWLHVRNYRNDFGWIFIGTNDLNRENVFIYPYKNNNWEIFSVIELNGKTFTERKMEGMVSVFESLNVRDNPGVKETNVLEVIRPQHGQQVNLDVLAITEEVDFIDGMKDYWLKISYRGKTGWIFGGYTHFFGGGLRFNIPNDIVKSMFS